MSDPQTSWLLPIVVLAAGLVAGVWAARHWLLGGGNGGDGDDDDDDTAARDFDERLAQMVAQLRDLAEQRDRMEPADYDRQKSAYENAAAAMLRQRAEAAASQQGRRRKAEPRGGAALEKPAADTGDGGKARGGARTQLTGALWGGAVVAVLATLLYFVGVDSTPKPDDGGMGGTGGTGGTGGMVGARRGGAAPITAPVGSPQAEAALDDEGRALMQRLQQSPDDLDALVRLAHRFLRGMMLREAGYLTDRALRIAPNNPEVLTHQAVLKAAAGDRDGAMQELNTIVQEHPELAEAWFFRGMTAMQAGDQVMMRDSFEKFLALSDDEQQKQRVRAMLGGMPAP